MRVPPGFDVPIVVAAAGLCVATATALLAGLGWPFELFSHFRLQYLVVGAVVAAAALLRRRRGTALAALVATALNGVDIGGGEAAAQATTGADACHGPHLTVVAANVNFRNTDHASLLGWLQRQPADVVLLEEVTEEWANSLEKLPGYPYRALRPREDPYGMAVLSRLLPDSIEWLDLAGDGVPTVALALEVDGEPLQILGLHTTSPVARVAMRSRDRELERGAERSRSAGSPTVLLGDLNVSPDSPVFSRLLRDGNLRDSLAGSGWHPTWRTDFYPLALRIDHVLASPGVCVESAEVGPPIGSDHRPVRAELRLPHAPASTT
jgi:endonuclease/exonuclease/phosphatase (EEP) superfamily protein YafD